MSLKNKLNRLKPHLSGGGPATNHTPAKESANIEIPFLSKWENENVTPYLLDQDYCLIREVTYPLTQKHGHYHFQDFLTAVDIWNRRPISHPLSAEGHHAHELFFFDTETTGLGGGAGNTIFLLGYASVIGENLVLRQHILPHPGAEVPLYKSFLEKVNYKTLVTYNGKSFDWPQVKTRHTLVRDHVPRLPSFGHFDLFHAARRLWKHKLDRLKLSVVEKEVLGVERQDDIPGYLAPMIYFDFIESKQPDGMLGIMKHNEIDILSLVTLYTHLTFQLCGRDTSRTRKESFEVGRWYASLGEKNEAKKVLTKLVEGSDLTSLQAKLTLAYQFKKEQDWESSLPLFIEAAEAGNAQFSFDACVEASKIYEHKLKDYKLALDYCLLAEELLGNTKASIQKILVQLEIRRNRLEGKIAKFSR
ncbi:ribonuclease H-like domain-containing protein [Neobacillus niacini]|uniref:ribonuclease H-like domain-containing protein n=1 Tax=Neobacillus niacini TaxID=86668 RepID=UPI0039833465